MPTLLNKPTHVPKAVISGRPDDLATICIRAKGQRNKGENQALAFRITVDKGGDIHVRPIDE